MTAPPTQTPPDHDRSEAVVAATSTIENPDLAPTAPPHVLSDLVAGAVIVAAAGGFALATTNGVRAADVVRLVLLIVWAGAGAAVCRTAATRQLGAVALAGTGIGALRSVAVGLREREELLAGAELVEPLAAALVIAVGVHLIAALPSGDVRGSTARTVVGGTYALAALVGVWRYLADDVGAWPLFVLGALGVAAIGPTTHRRYVESRGVVRQRLQWVGLASALVVETILIVGTLHLLIDWPPAPGVVVGGSLVLLAAALLAGSSKRLVGKVESLLQHTVSFAGSSAIVVATYLIVVVGLGRVPTDDERTILVLSMLAAAIAALVFIPARTRLAETANRLVYGESNDPTEALETFGQRMTRALPMDELLLQLVELLKKHLGLVSAEVWSGTDGRFERFVSVPDRGPGALELGDKELPVVARAGVTGRAWANVWLPSLLEGRGLGPVRISPMTSQGEVFGLMVVERGEQEDDFTEEDERVLTELSRQVGLALKNSSLDLALQASLEEVKKANVELRSSRARIVASADLERRKIERNLHDGAQQHLVALAVKLRLIQRIAEADPAQAMTMIEEARGDVLATVEELRALAHGIYPPLLMDRGLPEALRAAAGRAVLPTTVEADGLERYDQDVEAAVYFCILEALQNAGKHAGEDASIEVSVVVEDDELRFAVVDDGAGFDTAGGSRGHGFVNMADRLGAIGGSVQVSSAPGQGTRIEGRLPARPRAEPEPTAS